MNNIPCTPEGRKTRVKELFSKIELIAKVCGKDHSKRDTLHKPLADELWEISKYQLDNKELNHFI